jgi:hypothetical protein
MRYNKVTAYLGQVGNKRNITTNGHSKRKEFWPSPYCLGATAAPVDSHDALPLSMAQTKHTAEWHLSTRNIYSAKFSLFLKLVYPSYTHCIPDIYPLYTWYIPIVYPSSSIQDWMGLKLTSRPSTTWYRMFWSKYRNQLPYSQGNRNWSWKFVPSPVMVIYYST